jgi:HlyD family secretion protein
MTLDLENTPPSRVMAATVAAVCGLCALLLIWAAVGKLDIIATAEGKLVPQTFIKIVQPSDSGVVEAILVKEGQRVQAGQVLMRMDRTQSEADTRTFAAELQNKDLQLRRIDAELGGSILMPKGVDTNTAERAALFAQVSAQYRDRRQSYTDALNAEREQLKRAQSELQSGKETLTKLRQSVPVLKATAEGYESMGKDGYVAALQVQDKVREYQERAQDLKSQEATVASLEAAVAQSHKKMEQVTSNYRSALQNERVEAQVLQKKMAEELNKQTHRATFLELKAPQAGIVKDLGTHTLGTVVSPGTILLTLVPDNEPLVAEVQIKNDDVGFILEGQKAKIKLMPYPFQKYGMLEAKVQHIGPDAQDAGGAQGNAPTSNPQSSGTGKSSNMGGGMGGQASMANYKALVMPIAQTLIAQGQSFKLLPGMQVVAEIHLGRRTVLEYLLSPVQQTLQTSGRER